MKVLEIYNFNKELSLEIDILNRIIITIVY